MNPAQAALDVFLLHADDDEEELLEAMVAHGIAAEEAWRQYQVVPIAFARRVLQDRGVHFSDAYLLEYDSGERTEHAWEDLPAYRDAFKAADERVRAGLTQEQMISVARHSAEFDAVLKLATGQDLSGIHLVECVLFDQPPDPG